VPILVDGDKMVDLVMFFVCGAFWTESVGNWGNDLGRSIRVSADIELLSYIMCDLECGCAH
jgi:hypothetical protein